MFKTFEQITESSESQSPITRAIVCWTTGAAIAAFEFQTVLMMLDAIE